LTTEIERLNNLLEQKRRDNEEMKNK